MSTGWSQADSQIQSTLWLQAHHPWLCRHSRMSWSSGRVGRVPNRWCKQPAGKGKALLAGAPACAWLPAQGRAGSRAELAAPGHLVALAPAAAPGAVPSVPRVTQVGLDCEGISAMSSQRCVQRGQPAPLAVLLCCCSPGVTGRGPGKTCAFSPITRPPPPAFLSRESAKPSQKEASPQGLSVGPCAGA